MKKNKFITLFAVLFAVLGLGLVQHSFADTLAEQTLEEYFQADENLKTTNAAISHSAFTAGNNVENNAQVDGILLSAGNNLKNNGTAEYAFLAGNNLDVNGDIEKDLFIAGNVININASVKRDAFIAGHSITINKDIEHNAFIGASELKIADNVIINGNLQVDVDTLALGDNVKINGILSYNKNAQTHNLNSANYGSVSTYEDATIDAAEPSPASKLLFTAFKYISALIIFSLIVLIFPKVARRFSEATKNPASIAKQLGFGILALIIVPIVCFLLIFTIVGIPLGVISLVLYALALYFSVGASGTYLGHLVLTKVFRAKANAYGAIALGLLLITLLTLVPLVGGMIRFLAIILGFGIIIDLVFSKRT